MVKKEHPGRCLRHMQGYGFNCSWGGSNSECVDCGQDFCDYHRQKGDGHDCSEAVCIEQNRGPRNNHTSPGWVGKFVQRGVAVATGGAVQISDKDIANKTDGLSSVSALEGYGEMWLAGSWMRLLAKNPRIVDPMLRSIEDNVQKDKNASSRKEMVAKTRCAIQTQNELYMQNSRLKYYAVSTVWANGKEGVSLDEFKARMEAVKRFCKKNKCGAYIFNVQKQEDAQIKGWLIDFISSVGDQKDPFGGSGTMSRIMSSFRNNETQKCWQYYIQYNACLGVISFGDSTNPCLYEKHWTKCHQKKDWVVLEGPGIKSIPGPSNGALPSAKLNSWMCPAASCSKCKGVTMKNFCGCG